MFGFRFLEPEPVKRGRPLLTLDRLAAPSDPSAVSPRWLAVSRVTSGPRGCPCPAFLGTRMMGVTNTRARLVTVALQWCWLTSVTDKKTEVQGG